MIKWTFHPQPKTRAEVTVSPTPGIKTTQPPGLASRTEYDLNWSYKCVSQARTEGSMTASHTWATEVKDNTTPVAHACMGLGRTKRMYGRYKNIHKQWLKECCPQRDWRKLTKENWRVTSRIQWISNKVLKTWSRWEIIPEGREESNGARNDLRLRQTAIKMVGILHDSTTEGTGRRHRGTEATRISRQPPTTS